MAEDDARGDANSDGKPPDDIQRDTSDESTGAQTTVDGGHSFVDEELIPILVIGGVLLFLFPEPITSTLGLVLVGLGVGLWVWDIVR